MPKGKANFEEKFLTYKANVYPAMVGVLSEQLGVTVGDDIGFFPGEQAWILPERDDCGNIIGLIRRYHNGKKFMVPGSKRGLAYECVGNADKSGRVRSNSKFVRCYVSHVDCPLCGKRKWCMVSDDDINNPSAVICGHTEKGSIRHIKNSGYLHRLRDTGNSRASSVLPISDKPYIVVEGWSDVWAAKDMEYVAVGKPNSDSGLDLLASLLKGKDVIVVGENDEAGRRGMQKTFNALRSYCDSIQKVLPPVKYKDLRAWHPTADEFEQWLSEKADTASNEKVVAIIDYMALAESWLKSQDSPIKWFNGDWYKYTGVCYQEIKKQWIEKRIRDYFRDYEFVKYVNNVKTIKPLQIDKKFVEEIRLALQSNCFVDVPKGVYEPFYIGKKVNLDLTRSVIFVMAAYLPTSGCKPN